VTFTAPASGASGTFTNGTRITQATTDSNGVATATTFTANATAGGPYNVVASATGLTNVNFALTNTALPPPPSVVSYKVLFGSTSYNLIGSTRKRLPWEITGIQVVFSQPITIGNANSLTGLTATGFSGLGTATLTWTIHPIALGSYSTTLLATGSNALKDGNGNTLAGGTFAQNFKVLWGDFNDDGVVSASDGTLVNNIRIAGNYNIFADMNGDGVVNTTDVNIVRGRIGTSQP
jgi:hypothetical protein